MIGATVIVLAIVIIGIALFWGIRKFASVESREVVEIYDEASLTDFEAIQEDVPDELKSSVFVHITTRIKCMSEDLHKQKQSLTSRVVGVVKSMKQMIQTAWQESAQPRNDSESLQDKESFNQPKIQAEYEDLDTKFLENNPQPKPQHELPTQVIIEPQSPKGATSTGEVKYTQPSMKTSQSMTSHKADSFVEQLLSEEPEIEEPKLAQDVSDSYYYSYMEKRYINKIMQNPRDISAYKKLGDLYIEMRNYPDAHDSFQTVLKLKPEDSMALRRIRELKARIESQVE